ncbi:MAG: hypothetical protein B6229_04945 [Spirochaetaceae bacterium 4572_7]|nr:MAG: hypothetical protein B6229_04945 [Spirochaetaceae bacterium 4572_7]
MDIAIFVLPPKVGIKILEDINHRNSAGQENLKIKTVWFQPGAEDNNTIDFCKENNIDFISNSCIMTQSNLH